MSLNALLCVIHAAVAAAQISDPPPLLQHSSGDLGPQTKRDLPKLSAKVWKRFRFSWSSSIRNQYVNILESLVEADAIVRIYSPVFFGELIQQRSRRLSLMLLWLPLPPPPTCVLMSQPSVMLLSGRNCWWTPEPGSLWDQDFQLTDFCVLALAQRKNLNTFLGIFSSPWTVMAAEWPLTDNVLLEHICISNLLHSGQFYAPLEWCRNVNNVFPRNTNPPAFQWNGFLSGLYLFKSIEVTYWDSLFPRAHHQEQLRLKTRVAASTEEKREIILAKWWMMGDGWWAKQKSSGVSKMSTKTP